MILNAGCCISGAPRAGRTGTVYCQIQQLTCLNNILKHIILKIIYTKGSMEVNIPIAVFRRYGKRALSAAGISETYNFHCLRHSFLDSLKLRKTRCDACIGKRNGHTIHSAIVGSPFQQNYGDLYPCIESVYCKYKKPRG